MDLQLAPGTILDERYRIVRTLGQGGFGITYLAENIRLSMPVAIKELFWRDHCVRSEEIPSRVVLRHSHEAQMFAAQMERFLREARALRDYADQPGVVRILDYFEANATAYIVMEYIEGETLSQKIEQEGPFSEEQAVRAMIPLARSLAGIHSGGLIHRDISPENIMVRQDGSLTLIDFGAARPLTQKKSFTAIGKDHYAAPEQHDEKGKQGPWTDVYGFCATLYFCVTGTPPTSAVQRLFLDELVAPSSLAPALSKGADALMIKGLDMDRSRRFQDMAVLAQEMEKLLPQDPPHPVHRGWIWLAAALLVVAVGLGAWQYANWKHDHPFYGIETMRFLLTPGETLSAREYASYQEKLRSRLSAFVGPEKYQIRQEGASLEVMIPASAFGNECADTVLQQILFDETDSTVQDAIQLETEVLVNWEDPATSLMPGELQVKSFAFSDSTILCVYQPDTFDSMTKGELASLISDLKTRLDALNTPYAFGLQRGTNDRFVIRLSPSQVGWPILEMLGSNNVCLGSTLSEFPQIHYSHTSSGLSIQKLEDGSRVVVCEDKERLKELSEVFLRYGEDRLYLMTVNGHIFLKGNLKETVLDGKFVLDQPCLLDDKGKNAPADNIVSFLDAMITQTNLPCVCVLKKLQRIDAQGQPLLGKMDISLFGIHSPEDARDAAMRNDLIAFTESNGLRFYSDPFDRKYVVYADYPMNDSFPEKAMNLLRQMLSTNIFSELRTSKTVYLIFTDEDQNGLWRCVFSPTYDYDTMTIDLSASIFMSRNPVIYSDALMDSWEQLDLENYGCKKLFSLVF